MPSNLTKIGGGETEQGAFYNCIALTSITLPETLVSIDSYAFQESGIMSVIIPEKVTAIEPGTFNNCTSLTSVKIKGKVTEIGDNAFSGCTEMYDVSISETCTKIGAEAFAESKITAAYMKNVTSPGEKAFYDCKYLSEVVFSDEMTYIPNYCFTNADFNNIEIPANIKVIGDGAFADCALLESLYIDSSVVLGNEVFSNCASLNFIYFEQALPVYDADVWTGVSSDAVLYYNSTNNDEYLTRFNAQKLSDLYEYNVNDKGECTIVSAKVQFIPSALEHNGKICPVKYVKLDSFEMGTSIRIPYTITALSENSFENMNELKSIAVSAYNDEYSSINGVLYNKAQTYLIYYPQGKASKSYTIPREVTGIAETAFIGNNLSTIYVESGSNNFVSAGNVLYNADMTKVIMCPANKANETTIHSAATAIADYAFYNYIGKVKMVTMTAPEIGEHSLNTDTEISTYSTAEGFDTDIWKKLNVKITDSPLFAVTETKSGTFEVEYTGPDMETEEGTVIAETYKYTGTTAMRTGIGEKGTVSLVAKYVIDGTNKLVETALQEVGYTEKDSPAYENDEPDDESHAGHSNYTKYGRWYGLDGEYWCDMFVSWCANEVGYIEDKIIPKTAACRSAWAWFSTRGLTEDIDSDYEPKAGDLIVRLTPGTEHIGIVESYDSETDTVYTIEGNTTSKGFSDNGGGVYRKSYTGSEITNRWSVYCTPAYLVNKIEDTDAKKLEFEIDGDYDYIKVYIQANGKNASEPITLAK